MNTNILSSLSYGMYAIGVKDENRTSASIANTVFQVVASPSIVAVSINHKNYTNECIKKYGEFTISVLSENTPGTIIGTLGFSSGRDVNKLETVSHKILQEGLPVIKEETCCWLLCNVIDSIETQTHTIFISKVIAGSEEVIGVPMTYKYYHEVIKGSSPKNAPTYQPRNVIDNDRYVCRICGYIYNDIGRAFDDLPENWICPICKAPKSEFRLKRSY